MASFGSALGRSPGKISVSPTKRREMDVMKLMMSDYEVTTNSDDNVTEFWVKFNGPKDTPYEGGVWQVHVELPDQYPYKSPSIGFANRIYHPNVDEVSGSVCLDVINQTWSPMYELINVFETFLPQLLGYPNPGDPMNGEAAALLMDDPETYARKVREYVQRFARPEDARVPRPTPKHEEEEDTPMPDAHGDSDVEDLEL